MRHGPNQIPKPGDIANIRYHTYASDQSLVELKAALILSYCESNVYEPASCEVLHNGDIFWVEAKCVTLFFEHPSGGPGN